MKLDSQLSHKLKTLYLVAFNLTSFLSINVILTHYSVLLVDSI